jgi:hypothetical protein
LLFSHVRPGSGDASPAGFFAVETVVTSGAEGRALSVRKAKRGVERRAGTKQAISEAPRTVNGGRRAAFARDAAGAAA